MDALIINNIINHWCKLLLGNGQGLRPRVLVSNSILVTTLMEKHRGLK